ncbi:MAG: hypothetical protein C0467_31530, partial [Planctomycetaceae bacterium]|nr:hypothetical protein [Planctomycetaceae bacterium]
MTHTGSIPSRCWPQSANDIEIEQREVEEPGRPRCQPGEGAQIVRESSTDRTGSVDGLTAPTGVNEPHERIAELANVSRSTVQ